MKRVLLKGKILQKQLAHMQLEVNKFMTFVEEVLSKEAASNSGQGYQ